MRHIKTLVNITRRREYIHPQKTIVRQRNEIKMDKQPTSKVKNENHNIISKREDDICYGYPKWLISIYLQAHSNIINNVKHGKVSKRTFNE